MSELRERGCVGVESRVSTLSDRHGHAGQQHEGTCLPSRVYQGKTPVVSGDSSGMPMERYEEEYGWQLLLRE